MDALISSLSLSLRLSWPDACHQLNRKPNCRESTIAYHRLFISPRWRSLYHFYTDLNGCAILRKILTVCTSCRFRCMTPSAVDEALLERSVHPCFPIYMDHLEGTGRVVAGLRVRTRARSFSVRKFRPGSKSASKGYKSGDKWAC